MDLTGAQNNRAELGLDQTGILPHPPGGCDQGRESAIAHGNGTGIGHHRIGRAQLIKDQIASAEITVGNVRG